MTINERAIPLITLSSFIYKTIPLAILATVFFSQSFNTAFAMNCEDQSAHAHHAHQDDASKMHEHMAIFAVVSCDKITHSAVRDGAWFNPSTWDQNEVPGNNANVYIPKDISIDYSGENNARLASVRVDGNLNFAPNQDSTMLVETFVTAPGSNLIIGTEDNPIASGKKVEIIFLENGVIDLNKDPEQLGRGLVSHGRAIMHGQQKTTFLKLHSDALAGDTALKVESMPLNWQIDDRLVLGATQYEVAHGGGFKTKATQDEILYVKGIEDKGSYVEITIDRPLQYDHAGYENDKTLQGYVANYSRNIVFKTELNHSSYADLPAHQRAHTMFMHGEEVDIRYAEFFELGRTDKSIEMDGNDRKGNNFIGRYAFHFHRLGVGLNAQPAIAIGNAVWGSPGLGYVHHDSYAIMSDNAAFNVLGAAFVSESGNETGIWENNISIKTIGASGAKIKGAHGTFDIGRSGIGYWFQSRLVYSIDNIAISNPSHGFVYFHRPTSNSINLNYGDLDVPQIARYRGLTSHLGRPFSFDRPSIQQFTGNNETIASRVGLEVIKNSSIQRHDARTVIEDFTAWNVQNGIHLQYTGHYNIANARLYAHDDSKRYDWTSKGIATGQNMIDIVIQDSHAENFYTGINIPTKTGWEAKDNFVIKDFASVNNVERLKFTVPADNVVDAPNNSFSKQPMSLNISNQSDLVMDRSIKLVATKTDSFGSYPLYVNPNRETGEFRNVYEADFDELKKQAAYRLPNGDWAVIWEEIITDRIFPEDVKRYEVLLTLPSAPDSNVPFGGTLDAEQINGVWTLKNHAPYAARDFLATGVNQSINNLKTALTANDSDYENDTLNILSFTEPQNGRIINDNGNYRYEPNQGFSGVDYFEYVLDDGKHAANAELRSKALVRVWVDRYNQPAGTGQPPEPQPDPEPVNQLPVVQDLTVEIEQDSGETAFIGSQFGSDPDGDTVYFNSANGASNGRTLIFGEGFFLSYTPNPGFTGTEIINVELWDQQEIGKTVNAILTINVLPKPGSNNQLPIVQNLTIDIEQDSGQRLINGAEFGSDPDGDTVYFNNATGAQNGNTGILGEGFFLSYTPNPGFNGQEVITVELWDQVEIGKTVTAILTINVLPKPDTPQALNINEILVVDASTDTPLFALQNNMQITQSNNIAFVVRNNGQDVKSVLFHLTGATNRRHVENVPEYVLPGNSGTDYKGMSLNNGSHTLSITGFDSSRATGNSGDTLELNFTIEPEAQEPANQLPNVQNLTIDIEQDSGEQTFTGAQFGSDPNGDTVYFNGASGATNGTTRIFGEGFFMSYTPNPGFSGQEVINVELWDQVEIGKTVTATLTINVLPKALALDIGSIWIADAITDALLFRLSSGMEITESKNIAFVVRSPGKDIQSVTFKLTGATKRSHTENVPAYVLPGNNKADYKGMGLNPGEHRISVTGFEKDRATGEQGKTINIRFSVKN